MTTDDLQRLDDDLRDLVKRESHAPDLPSDRVSRARARLELRLALGAGVGAAAAATATAGAGSTLAARSVSTLGAAKALGLAKVGAVVALAFSGGIATGWAVSQRVGSPPAPLVVTTPSATPVTAPSPPPTPIETVDVDAVPSAAEAAPRAAPAASGTAAAPSVDLAPAERALLDQAGRALREGDPARAFALLDRHAKDFARGSLVEEREVLAVNALVSLGRADDAKARAAAFRRRFPTSPFLPAIDSQLRGL